MPAARKVEKIDARMSKRARSKLLSAYADSFVECRALRHAWEVVAPGDRRPQFGTLVTLRCWRCGTTRYDKFSRLTGERIASPSYVWPDGYRDVERQTHAFWRAAWGDRVHDLGLSVDADE